MILFSFTAVGVIEALSVGFGPELYSLKVVLCLRRSSLSGVIGGSEFSLYLYIYATTSYLFGTYMGMGDRPHFTSLIRNGLPWELWPGEAGSLE